MKSYRFKFGDQVKITESFFGDITGTVLSVQEIRTGWWPFRKKTLVYQIDAVVMDQNGDELECGMFVEEKFLEPIKSFEPKVIK